MKRSLLLQIVFVVVSCRAASAEKVAHDKSIKLTLSALARTELGSPIFGNLTMENIGDSAIKYEKSPSRIFYFEVERKKGDDLFVKASPTWLITGYVDIKMPQLDILEPNEVFKRKEEFGNLFDFSLPGIYRIKAFVILENKNAFFSNEIQIQVYQPKPLVEVSREIDFSSRNRTQREISLNALRVSMSIPVKNVVVAKMAMVSIKLTNDSDKRVEFVDLPAFENYNITVSTNEDDFKTNRPLQEEVMKSLLFREYKTKDVTGDYFLNAHESICYSVPLNFLFDLTRCCHYYVQVTASFKLKGETRSDCVSGLSVINICYNEYEVKKAVGKDHEMNKLKE